MHHDTPLISTIVAGLVLAFIFGMIANRFRLPPLVGYLFAGVLVGPHTPGFVADQALGAELAELGVILLMFGVGLHFSLKDLMSVRALAIPGAVVQIAFATALGAGLGLLQGWPLGGSFLFGLALSVASTVVLLKALQDRRLIETERGRIAVGWLIVEDLAMVLALVLIPAFAGLNGGDSVVHDPFVSFVERVFRTEIGIWGVLTLTIVKVAAFVGFMLIVGRRIIPWGLHATAHTGSRELFRLAVLAIALGVALGSAVLFGVSLALGAFFAGMILSESELSHRAAQETLPLRDAFSVLFFVSVGMLFDPAILVTSPLPVIATVLIIIIGKSLASFFIVLLFRRPVATALTISASLAQIGEFSFILATLGLSLGLLPQEGQDLILAGALISIILNPVVFWGVDLLRPRFEARLAQRRAAQEKRDGVRIEPTDKVDAAEGPITTDVPGEPAVDYAAPRVDDDLPAEPSRQIGHTILVGFGRVGGVVGRSLQASGSPLVVIEDSDHSVATARTLGMEVVVGNAASAEVLRLANVEAAKCLMIAIPDAFEAGTVCETGRKLNPSLRIIARAHSDEEEAHLREFGADTVVMGEREIGLGMLAWQRGERVEEVSHADAEIAEPKLPPSDNILAAAAAVAVPVSTNTPIPEGMPTEAHPSTDVAVVHTNTSDAPVEQVASQMEPAQDDAESKITAEITPISSSSADVADVDIEPVSAMATVTQPEADAVAEPAVVPEVEAVPALAPTVETPAESEPVATAAEEQAPAEEMDPDTPDQALGAEERQPDLGELISPDGTVVPLADLPAETSAEPRDENTGEGEAAKDETSAAPPVMPEPKN